MTDETCPMCDERIEEFERLDAVTYAIHPCGYQVDDLTYEKLSEGEENPG